MNLTIKEYKGDFSKYLNLIQMTLPKEKSVEIESSAFNEILNKIISIQEHNGYNASDEIEDLVKENKLSSYISFSVQETSRGGLSFITIKNLIIKLEDRKFTFFRTPNRTKEHDVSLFIENCVFQDYEGKSIYGHEIEITNHSYIKLSIYIENCKLNNASLKIQSHYRDTISIQKTEVLDLIIRTHGTLKLQKMTILAVLNIGSHVTRVKINDCWISTFDTANISSTESKLEYFSFDEDNYINEDQTETYRALGSLIQKPHLKNRIQEHILYKKELGSFIKNTKSLDDRLLFRVNSFLNKNGTSFIRPVILMITLNYFFILVLNISISQIGEINFFETLTKTFFMALDISPLNEFRYELSDTMHGIDGFRRVILAILTYSTISAAVRFKFKS